ncbi:MAG: hypothetical protein P4K97_04555 [Terracidiphilus sp.]|nr:hypothetical protein [Terracidiphilus sp.]
MANILESTSSEEKRSAGARPFGWIRLGAVAAVSVFAGGLAAAWWYRKTLTALRQAEENGTNPQYGNFGDDPSDEG